MAWSWHSINRFRCDVGWFLLTSNGWNYPMFEIWYRACRRAYRPKGADYTPRHLEKVVNAGVAAAIYSRPAMKGWCNGVHWHTPIFSRVCTPIEVHNQLRRWCYWLKYGLHIMFELIHYRQKDCRTDGDMLKHVLPLSIYHENCEYFMVFGGSRLVSVEFIFICVVRQGGIINKNSVRSTHKKYLMSIRCENLRCNKMLLIREIGIISCISRYDE